MEPINTKAYSIFHSEVSKCILSLETIFSHTPTAEELKSARIATHRLKGGAGFFGLDGLGKTGGNVEQLILTDQAQSKKEIEIIQELIAKLKVLATEMPPPTTVV